MTRIVLLLLRSLSTVALLACQASINNSSRNSSLVGGITFNGLNVDMLAAEMFALTVTLDPSSGYEVNTAFPIADALDLDASRTYVGFAMGYEEST
ncbi:hypothetical protein ONZ45_g14751 [Pleurotus djamor]|nr:hypothetical protein ONZ45_g14751 [Pleurotus djamor]